MENIIRDLKEELECVQKKLHGVSKDPYSKLYGNIYLFSADSSIDKAISELDELL